VARTPADVGAAASVAALCGRADTRRTMRTADAPDGGESDEDLMLAYARGSHAAFERLYARHRGGTYRYLLRHTGDVAGAEEMHQDLWMKVVRAADGYRPDARFATWLYTLARNRLVDHWRSRRGAHLTSLEDEGVAAAVEAATGDGPAAADPLAIAIERQAGRRLVSALSGVPPAQRDAFLLHVEGGLTLSEIAALNGASVETVKSRLRYAYGKLRAALEDLQ